MTKTMVDRMRRDGTSRVKRPVSEAFRFAECFKHLNDRCVAFIFRVCDPSAVIRPVRAVVVAPIDLLRIVVARLLRPGKECLEIAPFLANINPALAIAAIAGIVGIGAALNHGAPYSVDPLPAQPSSMSVNSRNAAHPVAFQTATGLRIPKQLVLTDKLRHSAVAPAFEALQVIDAVCGHMAFGERSAGDGPATDSITDLNRFHGWELYRVDANGNRSAVTKDLT